MTGNAQQVYDQGPAIVARLFASVAQATYGAPPVAWCDPKYVPMPPVVGAKINDRHAVPALEDLMFDEAQPRQQGRFGFAEGAYAFNEQGFVPLD